MAAIAGRRYTRLRIVVEQRTIIIKWIRILGTDYGYLLDKDCPTADLSNIGRPNGPAYSTGELLNTPLVCQQDKMQKVLHTTKVNFYSYLTLTDPRGEVLTLTDPRAAAKKGDYY